MSSSGAVQEAASTQAKISKQKSGLSHKSGPREKKFHCVVITCCGRKGGAGKTATVWNLAGELARRGFRVLLADLDCGNATLTGIALTRAQYVPKDGHPRFSHTLVHLLGGVADMEACLYPVRDNLQLLPASPELDEGEDMGGALDEAWRRLDERVLGPARARFDFVFLDGPAGWNRTVRAALRASDRVIVPVDASSEGLDCADGTLSSISSLEGAFGKEAERDAKSVWQRPSRLTGRSRAAYVSTMNLNRSLSEVVFKQKAPWLEHDIPFSGLHRDLIALGLGAFDSPKQMREVGVTPTSVKKLRDAYRLLTEDFLQWLSIQTNPVR